jgi:hypothetical protein
MNNKQKTIEKKLLLPRTFLRIPAMMASFRSEAIPLDFKSETGLEMFDVFGPPELSTFLSYCGFLLFNKIPILF